MSGVFSIRCIRIISKYCINLRKEFNGDSDESCHLFHANLPPIPFFRASHSYVGLHSKTEQMICDIL